MGTKTPGDVSDLSWEVLTAEEEELVFVLEDRWPVMVPQSDIVSIVKAIKHGVVRVDVALLKGRRKVLMAKIVPRARLIFPFREAHCGKDIFMGSNIMWALPGLS